MKTNAQKKSDMKMILNNATISEVKEYLGITKVVFNQSKDKDDNVIPDYLTAWNSDKRIMINAPMVILDNKDSDAFVLLEDQTKRSTDKGEYKFYFLFVADSNAVAIW